MKRRCDNRLQSCRALEVWPEHNPSCSLGYNLTYDYDHKLGINRNIRPVENCPKPMTFRELDEAKPKEAPR